MTSPHPTPQPTPESRSTGHTEAFNVIAWRYWEVRNRKLVSPYQFTELPANGIAVATCDTGHPAPGPTCLCGIAYYPTTQDMQQAITAMSLHTDPNIAYTAGTVTGHTYRDPCSLYRTGDLLTGLRWATPPPAWRAATYTALAVFTDHHTELDHALPIYTTDKMTDAQTLPGVLNPH